MCFDHSKFSLEAFYALRMRVGKGRHNFAQAVNLETVSLLAEGARRNNLDTLIRCIVNFAIYMSYVDMISQSIGIIGWC